VKRISTVFLILCACFVFVAWGQQPAGTCSNNWSEFHRTNMERWNPCEKVLTVHNVGRLELKWSYTTGNSLTTSSPAVANGVVYVGSEDDNVYALKASTGALLWKYTTGGQVWSSPAVANGVVYVGSYDNYVYALKASTGALLWSYTTGSGVWSSPAVANGVVYVGSWDNNVYALKASTGARLWKYTTGAWVESSPAVANGVVYVGSWDNNVYAFGLRTGQSRLESHGP
jgi:outer membrane protein assembly factor BamB